MSKIFYHNLSKNIVNESERMDFMETYDNGDVIYKSEAGNALLLEIKPDELLNMISEYEKECEEYDE